MENQIRHFPFMQNEESTKSKDLTINPNTSTFCCVRIYIIIGFTDWVKGERRWDKTYNDVLIARLIDCVIHTILWNKRLIYKRFSENIYVCSFPKSHFDALYKWHLSLMYSVTMAMVIVGDHPKCFFV